MQWASVLKHPGTLFFWLLQVSFQELKAIKQYYFQENGSMLEQDLGILSNSHIGQLLKVLAEGAREENGNLDSSLADKDVADLLSVRDTLEKTLSKMNKQIVETLY